MISFLMMAKNVEQYIGQAIEELQIAKGLS